MSPRRGVPPPNYTQAPNVLFDELLKDKTLTFVELKVLMVVIRHTIGWHEDESQLSLSDLEDRAALSRQGAINGANACVDRGTIERRVVGVPGAQNTFYALNLAGQEIGLGLVNEIDQAQSTDLTSSSQQNGPALSIGGKKTKETPLEPPQGGLEEKWVSVLEGLVDVVPGMTLRSFREHLSIGECRGEVLVLAASDDTVASWTRANFLPQIEAAAAKVFGASIVVELPKSETELQREQREQLRRRRPPKPRKGFLS